MQQQSLLHSWLQAQAGSSKAGAQAVKSANRQCYLCGPEHQVVGGRILLVNELFLHLHNSRSGEYPGQQGSGGSGSGGGNSGGGGSASAACMLQGALQWYEGLLQTACSAQGACPAAAPPPWPSAPPLAAAHGRKAHMHGVLSSPLLLCNAAQLASLARGARCTSCSAQERRLQGSITAIELGQAVKQSSQTLEGSPSPS